MVACWLGAWELHNDMCLRNAITSKSAWFLLVWTHGGQQQPFAALPLGQKSALQPTECVLALQNIDRGVCHWKVVMPRVLFILEGMNLSQGPTGCHCHASEVIFSGFLKTSALSACVHERCAGGALPLPSEVRQGNAVVSKLVLISD